jgi:hypothetical protein
VSGDVTDGGACETRFSKGAVPTDHQPKATAAMAPITINTATKLPVPARLSFDHDVSISIDHTNPPYAWAESVYQRCGIRGLT